MTDYAKKIKNQENILEPRYTRFDEDWGRWLQDDFILKNAKGQQITGAHPVTLNDDRTFAERVISVLSSAIPYPEVFGAGGQKMEDKEATLREQLWNALVYDTDRRLLARGLGALHETLVIDGSLAGWDVVRPIVWDDQGRARFDILPGSPRWTTFEWGDNGLDWAAIKTPKSRAYAENKYGYKGNKKEVVVTDYEDKEVNAILVDGQTVEETENKMGYPRFVIKPSGMFPPRGRDSAEMIRTHGESIFAANRNLSKIKNEIASIAHTLTFLDYRPPTGVRSQDGNTVPTESPFEEASMIGLELQGGFEKLPIGELNSAAAFFLWPIVDAGFQRGALSYVDWGNPPFELSAVALESLKADRDQTFIPRIKLIVAVCRDVYHMLIDQFVKGGLPAEVGEDGQKVIFNPGDFKGDYSVKFGMRTVSAERDLSSFAIATSADRWFSNEDILRDVIKHPNPEQVMARKRDDIITGLMPEILLVRRWDDLKADAKKLQGDSKKAAEKEARLIEMKLDQLLLTPEVPEPTRGEGRAKGAEPTAGASRPQLMSAEEKVQREVVRRKGVKLPRGAE